MSSCPLPCLVFLVDDEKMLKSYSINGKELSEKKFNGKIKYMKLVTDVEFSEYLFIIEKQSNGDNEMSFRSLPYLQKDKTQNKVFQYDLVNMDVTPDNSFVIVLQENSKNKYDLVCVKEKQNEKVESNV